jgi:NAD(P)-dependent dehydrogenase (short-subunit alcohol dehydrogenase family)
MSGGRSVLAGQRVVVIGGSAGIGLETARLARDAGADVILTGRDPERLHRAGRELGGSIAAFDALDSERLARFFSELPPPVDHLMVTGPGPHSAPLSDFDFERGQRDVDAHLWLPIHVARHAAGKVRAGGCVLFMSGTMGRRPGPGLALVSALAAAAPALARSLALEIAPVRVNVIAAGFVDTPASASVLDDQPRPRRDALPVQRVVRPADIAALAVHLMGNTAVTGATYDIDAGQQLVSGQRS